MKTIKELREQDARKLSERTTPADIEKARHALRLYYRFVYAFQASFYASQNRHYTEAEKAAADLKSERAYKRAADALKPYKLKISCPGLYPLIEELNGANFTHGYFYNYERD